MIKVVAPNMALRVIDRAIQAFGGAGVSDDFPLAYQYAGAQNTADRQMVRMKCMRDRLQRLELKKYSRQRGEESHEHFGFI